jgi:hypothetical protein
MGQFSKKKKKLSLLDVWTIKRNLGRDKCISFVIGKSFNDRIFLSPSHEKFDCWKLSIHV